MIADHTPERRCTHPKPEFRWDGKQWGWVCPLCSTALVLVEAAHLADVGARLTAVEALLRDPDDPRLNRYPRWIEDEINAALHPDPSEVARDE